MIKKTRIITSLAILVLFLLSCSSNNDYLLLHQQVGDLDNNSFLLHDIKSKEAALIDAPSHIDTITAYLQENNLELKYIFLTHGHWDHVDGIHKILEQHPDAILCYSSKEFEAMQSYKEWALENIQKDEWAWLRIPSMQQLLDFDLKSIKEPDVDVSDNQTFRLGNTQIKSILTPGHSPGSVCYYTDKALFTGDVLLKGIVGRTDFYGSSWEDQIKSVRKLYRLFSEDTKVYPGHYDFTDIGTEKRYNKNITADEVIGKFELTK